MKLFRTISGCEEIGKKNTINLYVTRNRKLKLQTKKYMKSNNIKLKSRQDFQ